MVGWTASKHAVAARHELSSTICNTTTVKRVAGRVCFESRMTADGTVSDEEPLRWTLHGGPGAGKSHAISVLNQESFEGVLERTLNVDFQIATWRSVMADLFKGDTIHHALGVLSEGKPTATWTI